MIDGLPFPIQYGDFEDEDYAALDRYYCQPYYERNGQDVSYIRDKYNFLNPSQEDIEQCCIAIEQSVLLQKMIVDYANQEYTASLREIADHFLNLLAQGVASESTAYGY